MTPLASETSTGLSDERKGWLPIVLCPTDGVDRMLLLPDGREVVGAYRNAWWVSERVEYDETIYQESLRGGLLPMPWEAPAKRGERRLPTAIGTRKAVLWVTGKLAGGICPTHFRPNDTVYGDARRISNPQETDHG